MTEQTQPSNGRRRTAGALLWRQEMEEEPPFSMGGQSVDEQRRQIQSYAREMGMTVTEEFIGLIERSEETANRLGAIAWMLENRPVDCLIMTRACACGLDGDALFTFNVCLLNHGIDVAWSD